MVFKVQIEAPPLSEDATGALRVGNSRVLLEIVVRAFQDGATPETIVQRYSTLALPDVYSVLAYYLRHPSEVEEYLARREQKAEEIQRRDKPGIKQLKAVMAKYRLSRQDVDRALNGKSKKSSSPLAGKTLKPKYGVPSGKWLEFRVAHSPVT